MDLNTTLTPVESLSLLNQPEDVRELQKLARRGDVEEISERPSVRLRTKIWDGLQLGGPSFIFDYFSNSH